MARGLGRSKGCNNCLQRKIKCDEKTPACTQCTRGGRECSGPVSTVFLVVESDSVTTNPTYKPRDSDRTLEGTREEDSMAIVPSSSKTKRTVRDRKRATASPSHEYTLSPSIQSSQVFAEQYLSHFITFFAKMSAHQVIFNSWMISLPDMLAAKSSVLEKSIIAASMIYYGRVSSDTRIVVESYKWYGSGLNRQRKLLEDLQREKRPPTVEEICTPILLSFFEISCSTSPTAYFQHLMGAAKFLEMRGPEACSEGILNQLFLTLRIQLIYPCIITRVPSLFSTDDWLTVPFQGRPKTVFDRVIDTITRVSSLLARIDATHSPGNVDDAELERLMIKMDAEKIKAQLDMWWEEIREGSRIHGWEDDYYRQIPGFDFESPLCKSRVEHDVNPSVEHPEECTSTDYLVAPPEQLALRFYSTSRATAFYSTARILILSVLNELGQTPRLFTEQVEAHSESILSVAQCLTGMDIGYAYVRLVLPLTVVWRNSPIPGQRERAKNILERWRLKGGVAGICEGALATMQAEVW